MLKQIGKLWRGKGTGESQRHWDAALRILQKIDPNLVLTRLPVKERVLARIRFSFASQRSIDTWLNGRRLTQSEVSTGVVAPLKDEYGESRAFGLQVRVLEYAIQLRKAVYRGELTLGEMPLNPESEKIREGAGAQDRSNNEERLDGDRTTVRAFMASIQGAEIPSEAADDIIADYWNKLAFIAWEAAQLLREGSRDPWLQRAREYIDIALEGRPNWTPAQLNLARISASEGNREKALETLERVLGKETTSDAPPGVAPTPSIDPDAVATMILRMADEGNSDAIASHIRRSYGSLSQETIRHITESLAGKVSAGMLNSILRGVALDSITPGD